MDMENFPVNEVAKEMLSYVNTGFYDNSYVAKWLFEVMGQEMSVVKKYMEEIANQAFPQSATWGIEYQEIKYGIVPNKGLPLNERRKQVILKKSMKMPMNPAFLENQINTIIGHEGTAITENIADYTFVINISEIEDSSVIYSKVMAYVKKAKPSHMSFYIVGKYGASYLVKITYSNSIRFMSEFYARNNMRWLLLDGSWYLDGRYLLDLYENVKDTYISRMTYRSDIYLPCHLKAEVRSQSNVKYHIDSRGIAEIISDSHVISELGMEIEIIDSVNADIRCESNLSVEVGLWYLDGSVPLDGSNQLKSDIINIVL